MKKHVEKKLFKILFVQVGKVIPLKNKNSERSVFAGGRFFYIKGEIVETVAQAVEEE